MRRAICSGIRRFVWQCVLGQCAVDAFSSEGIVIPPLCEKPFAASRAPETRISVSRHDKENHPAKGNDECGGKAVEEVLRQQSNGKDARRIAQERKQKQVPTTTVFPPGVSWSTRERQIIVEMSLNGEGGR